MAISFLEHEFDLLWDKLYPNIDLDIEVPIIPNRRFRFDYVNKPSKVAIEVNGGIWQQSGHSSGVGLMRDYQKINLAIFEGWVVFQLSAEMIDSYWLDIIAETIRSRSPVPQK